MWTRKLRTPEIQTPNHGRRVGLATLAASVLLSSLMGVITANIVQNNPVTQEQVHDAIEAQAQAQLRADTLAASINATTRPDSSAVIVPVLNGIVHVKNPINSKYDFDNVTFPIAVSGDWKDGKGDVNATLKDTYIGLQTTNDLGEVSIEAVIYDSKDLSFQGFHPQLLGTVFNVIALPQADKWGDTHIMAVAIGGSDSKQPLSNGGSLIIPGHSDRPF